MVATQEATATRIGLDVLKRGGNAVDVAVGFALAVTLPRAGNLGGGGFMLIHMAEAGETLALDYREEAPAVAGRDLFLGADGEVDDQRARFSYLSAGVPGTVVWPASPRPRHASAARPWLRVWPETARIFFRADGSAYRAGERLVQADLAWGA